MKLDSRLTSREVSYLHELLIFKGVSATKSWSMSRLVNDQELKNILKQYHSTTQAEIKQLKHLLQPSVPASREAIECSFQVIPRH